MALVALQRIKMFKFITQIFVSALIFFGSLSNVNPLECISMSNQECKLRPTIVNIDSNEPLFYPFSIKTSKSRHFCNNTNDLHVKLCVPDVVKNLIINVFSLMSRTDETKHIK